MRLAGRSRAARRASNETVAYQQQLRGRGRLDRTRSDGVSLSMIDGPAADQSFGCGRRPELLRVVRSSGGEWDCLDLLDDEPRPRETIYLYECIYRGPGMFMCVRGPGGGGGFQASGHYVFIIRATGELDAVCRETARWRAFVAAYFGVTIDWSDGLQVADVVPLERRR